MIRADASPLAFKEALEARLRERAAREGRSINRLRQLVVMERFLARVFAAFDSAVLKGGMVMELRLDGARATKDLDLRLNGRPDEILARMQAAGQSDLQDFLTFEVRKDAAHPIIEADGLRYEGLRFRAEARLAGRLYGSVFGVDIAVAEPVVGIAQPIDGSDALAFIGVARPTFLAYPITTHIAEKLHAYTLPRPRPNSRVKDLPDIALLADSTTQDANKLRSAILETFANRRTHAVPVTVPDPPSGWDATYARMAIEGGFRWTTLDSLVVAVRAFLDPVLGSNTGAWDPARWAWTPGRDEG